MTPPVVSLLTLLLLPQLLTRCASLCQTILMNQICGHIKLLNFGSLPMIFPHYPYGNHFNMSLCTHGFTPHIIMWRLLFVRETCLPIPWSGQYPSMASLSHVFSSVLALNELLVTAIFKSRVIHDMYIPNWLNSRINTSFIVTAQLIYLLRIRMNSIHNCFT